MEIENIIKNCSKSHKELKAIAYCQECKIYICNKCLHSHKSLFNNHSLFNLDKNFNENFTGFCKEENHREPLEFYCETHNKLCCSSCLCKINKKNKGQHKDCNVLIIEDIKEIKEKKLKENLIIADNLFNQLNNTIGLFNNKLEKINENKEKLKLETQKIFTQIRNNINEKEDQILDEIDKKFENTYFNENIIKKIEKLLIEIKKIKEMGEAIEQEWNKENKLSLLINNCLIIENKIVKINEDIKLINENKNKLSIEIFIKWNLNSLNKEIINFVKIISFKKIEYIESSGNQYINTNFEFNGKYNYTIEFALSSLITSDTKFFGIDTHPKMCIGTIDSQFRFFKSNYEKKIEFDLNKHTCTIGKNLLLDKNIIMKDMVFNHSNLRLYLFNANKDGFDKNIYGTSIKLYNFKITKNNDLIKEFIPVLDYNGIPCLFDITDKEFYYNLGDGNFNYNN